MLFRSHGADGEIAVFHNAPGAMRHEEVWMEPLAAGAGRWDQLTTPRIIRLDVREVLWDREFVRMYEVTAQTPHQKAP